MVEHPASVIIYYTLNHIPVLPHLTGDAVVKKERDASGNKDATEYKAYSGKKKLSVTHTY